MSNEPVAWMHTMHMEGGQTYTRLLDHDGLDEYEPRKTAFGFPGRDYSEEYVVTSEPLYTRPPADPESVVDTPESAPVLRSEAAGLVDELLWRADARDRMGYDATADYMRQAAARIQSDAVELAKYRETWNTRPPADPESVVDTPEPAPRQHLARGRGDK